MEKKTVKLQYTLTKQEVLSAYKLSGVEKERIKKNRNTTIWFVIIMLMFGFNIFSSLTSDKVQNAEMNIITSVLFELVCIFFICATWFGGTNIEKKELLSLADDVQHKVSITKDGITFVIGEMELISLEKDDFSLKKNDEIWLISYKSGKKLIIPLREISEKDKELINKFIG